ncbi:MAG: hypothetical protein JNK72_10385 [Myxococcales bacterium]|nr:hypothetical protein [Myxococcales bacterium]
MPYRDPARPEPPKNRSADVIARSLLGALGLTLGYGAFIAAAWALMRRCGRGAG